MKEQRRKAKPPALARITFAVTDKQAQFLAQWAQTASDELGQRYSSSALLRALVSACETKGGGWIRAEIFPLLERELHEVGLKWGKAQRIAKVQ